MFMKISNKLKIIVNFLQRTFRKHHTGDLDMIWFDTHLAKIIALKLKAFRNFKKIPLATPGELKDKKEWLNIIDKMIAAFESRAGIRELSDVEEKEGLELFVKWFHYLWIGFDL